MKSIAAVVVKASMSKSKQKPPVSPQAQYQEALASFNQGKLRLAVRTCCQLLKQHPEYAQPWHLMALALQGLKRLTWAGQALAKALAIAPEAAHYWNTQGVIAQAEGDPLRAMHAFQRAVSLNPQMFDTYLNLAMIYKAQRQWPQEQICYQRILLQDHLHINALMQYGIALNQRGRAQDAISCFKKILYIAPQTSMARFFLGICMQQLGLLEEAAVCYQQVIKDNPQNSPAYVNLGIIYRTLGQFDRAIAAYKKAIELDPKQGYIYTNLANALTKMEHYAEAVKVYQHALSLDKRHADTYNGLGYALQMQNMLDEARENYEAALALQPTHIDAHFNLAMVNLLQGHYDAGFREYAWRWQRQEMTLIRSLFLLTMWGGQPIRGKKLLVFAEQGFGDNIQFARYLEILMVEGVYVYLETYPELYRLFQSIRGLSGIVRRGSPTPHCDYMIPITGIAEFFTQHEESIPKIMPYLHSVGEPREKIKALTFDRKKRKIGICAAGKATHRNDHNRSCAFDALVNVVKRKDVQLFSLQKPAPDLVKELDLIDAGSLCDDFNDMAKVIEQLDLVITVDTGLAHLAGALNKPVWVLLPYVPDWRWQLNRSDTPWYPSMRLFRQAAPKDWGSVWHALTEALDHIETLL